MALKCRGEQLLDGLYTGINTQHLTMASKMVEEYSGLRIQPHKAIVGANAFTHESGIHQWTPCTESKNVGAWIRYCCKELDGLSARFKTVAGSKKVITDDDLIALVSDEIFQPQVVWKLLDIQVTCGSLGFSTAAVKLCGVNGDEHIACSVGTGPVDAAYKAVDLIVKVPVTLVEYSVNSMAEGIDAIATARVLIRRDERDTLNGVSLNRTFSGIGAAMDIVISSVRAYVGALNKMLGFQTRSKTKTPNEIKAMHTS